MPISTRYQLYYGRQLYSFLKTGVHKKKTTLLLASHWQILYKYCYIEYTSTRWESDQFN